MQGTAVEVKKKKNSHYENICLTVIDNKKNIIKLQNVDTQLSSVIRLPQKCSYPTCQ